jgi:hypothetical protein
VIVEETAGMVVDAGKAARVMTAGTVAAVAAADAVKVVSAGTGGINKQSQDSGLTMRGPVE